MSSIKPQTLKGFRDFLPSEARKRQYVIDILKKVFESYGFEPLETPALEYEEILTGKYGEEGDKLMYRFEDRGKRKVAMRYDQTVPLARVVAQYGNELPMPFKRYQIQNVWRADNTQKGRYREFLQCDADIVGSSSLLSDVEIISVVDSSLKKLGFSKYKIKFNNRELLFKQIKQVGIQDESAISVIRILDKIEKVGWQRIEEELKELKGIDKKAASGLFNLWQLTQPMEGEIKKIWDECSKRNIPVEPKLTLARGLDYYTGLIFEVEIDGYSAGSVCGGGRYDNLIGLFADKQIPAVGFAFGFDRLIEAMTELKRFPDDFQTTKVLVTVFSPALLEKSIEISSRLRSNNIDTELYLDENASLEKQLKYADKKGIPYAIIIGPEEAAKKVVTLRNMKTRKQIALKPEDIFKEI